MIGDGLDEVGFDGSYRLQFFVIGFAMSLVEYGVVGGQQDGLTGEGVADGVEAGYGFGCVAAGTGRFLGVGSVGG